MTGKVFLRCLGNIDIAPTPATLFPNRIDSDKVAFSQQFPQGWQRNRAGPEHLMDIHTRIVAVLHIVFGVIGAFFMLFCALAVGAASAFADLSDIPGIGFLLGFGVTAFLVLMALTVAEMVAGIALLNGSQTGRVFVIVFGVLGLANIPFGTALGIYTLWALLRKEHVLSSGAGR